MEAVDAEAITTFEKAPHGIITLQLHQRGFSLDLTYEEAAALGQVTGKVVEPVNTQQQH